MRWKSMKMELEKKFNEISENVFTMTDYDQYDVLKFYFKKLVTKVLDYCRREDLNVPLLDFIEDKLIEVANYEIERNKLLESSSTAVMNGIGIDKIKTISRGDTSITLNDNASKVGDVAGIVDPMEFTKSDYATLNRHRKVYR